jgi:hypothetical protein
LASDPQASEDLRLLVLESTTGFALSASGRILRQNDPDGSPGPRLFFASCAGGNLARVRHDVDDRTADEFMKLADKEPAWSDERALPSFADAVIARISADTRAMAEVAALCHRLPNGLVSDVAATIVSSGTAEGSALHARLADEMPPHLIEAGFLTTGDLWEPWCAAIEGGEIAALAFAARTGVEGLEVGVYTFPGFRGRGLAAGVTAAWSRLPHLTGKTLFYSCSASNSSSRRVVQRLGLRRIGLSLRIV